VLWRLCKPLKERASSRVLSMNTRKSLYRGLKDVWQILPPSWNEGMRRAPVLGQIVQLVAQLTIKSASHQEIYDKRYSAFLDAAASKSTGPMAATIKRLFKPNSVIDVGCGTGALLAQFHQNGLETRGLEYSDAGIARCRERGIQVEKFDLETDAVIAGSWDVSVSFEVAEHLPELMADNYVRVISRFSPVDGSLPHFFGVKSPSDWLKLVSSSEVTAGVLLDSST
jgi:SAM-dependent methyltransferase